MISPRTINEHACVPCTQPINLNRCTMQNELGQQSDFSGIMNVKRQEATHPPCVCAAVSSAQIPQCLLLRMIVVMNIMRGISGSYCAGVSYSSHWPDTFPFCPSVLTPATSVPLTIPLFPSYLLPVNFFWNYSSFPSTCHVFNVFAAEYLDHLSAPRPLWLISVRAYAVACCSKIIGRNCYKQT